MEEGLLTLKNAKPLEANTGRTTRSGHDKICKRPRCWQGRRAVYEQFKAEKTRAGADAAAEERGARGTPLRWR